jgi:hypothetical protein
MKPKFLITVLALLLVFPLMAAGCPGCSEALFDPAQAAIKAGTLRGYLISIALLLGLPVAMVAGVAVALSRASRRSQRVRRAG